MTRTLRFVALLSLCLIVPSPAPAADFPALPDGGSLVKPTDGGPLITVDLGSGRGTRDWVAAVRCSSWEGSPGAFVRFSSDAGDATSDYRLLNANERAEISVQQLVSVTRTERLRYFSIRSEDGGVPACRLLQQDIP